MCGIAAVDKAALKVRRRGGEAATQRAVWAPRGRGHACEFCESLVRSEGFGPGAMDKAVDAYLRGVGRKAQADRPRALRNEDAIRICRRGVPVPASRRTNSRSSTCGA